VSAPSWRQHRDIRSPCSVSASTTTREHASPRSASRARSRSARALAANAASSTRTAGGSSFHRLDQLRRHRQRPRALERLTAREPVCVHAGEAEAGEHRGLGELGEGAEGAQAEPHEQVGQLVATLDVWGEHAHRPRRQERRTLPRRHDQHVGRPGGETGREVAIGDATRTASTPGARTASSTAPRQRVVAPK